MDFDEIAFLSFLCNFSGVEWDASKNIKLWLWLLYNYNYNIIITIIIYIYEICYQKKEKHAEIKTLLMAEFLIIDTGTDLWGGEWVSLSRMTQV